MRKGVSEGRATTAVRAERGGASCVEEGRRGLIGGGGVRPTVQVDIYLARVGPDVLVALLVKDARRFAVEFPHQVVLGLAAEAEGFGGAGVVTVPSLGCAVTGSPLAPVSAQARVGRERIRLTSAGICSASLHV